MSSSSAPSPPVPDGQMNAFEAILRMCAASAPRPWHPRLYAQSVGMAPDRLYYFIEHLWLDGLVEKAEGEPASGPGLTLTPAGREVLDDPEALQRLKDGRAVRPGSRGGVVREAIRRPTRPIATQALIALNVVGFLYTMYLASQAGILSDFLAISPIAGGGAGVADLIDRAGGVSGAAWLNGQWWTLATSCFLHIGLMHIACNMFALYRVGAQVEQMWGSVRYVVIYLFAGLGGSCVALALAPEVVMAGASGALCGVMAAAAVWVLCNGRLLPRGLAGQMRSNLLINGVLIVFISLMPGVSWEGHLGGAVVGAFVALVMQVQRFGPSPWRWAALAALVPLPWAGYAFIQHERAVSPAWAGFHGRQVAAEKERKDFDAHYTSRVSKETSAAFNEFVNEGAVLDVAPDKRDATEAARVKANLGKQRDILKQLADELGAAGPYKDDEIENARKTAIRFVGAVNDLLATAERRLRDGEAWTVEDQSKIQKVKDASEEWNKLLR